jgi:hypothetical protein
MKHKSQRMLPNEPLHDGPAAHFLQKQVWRAGLALKYTGFDHGAETPGGGGVLCFGQILHKQSSGGIAVHCMGASRDKARATVHLYCPANHLPTPFQLVLIHTDGLLGSALVCHLARSCINHAMPNHGTLQEIRASRTLMQGTSKLQRDSNILMEGWSYAKRPSGL